ncbi:peptide-methionine (S)-S-oxide reductase MsrA [Streptomyces sp. NBC_00687]|uniref:peptide-methionine (S)-S-oxide reductase MsrA n=1 Tax=Streptomyces sp. NBC_00687 TaxID=2975807 RepID=UPI00225419F1|nr:peptide-methionine (S)-S-oxide reductase MsrA [Streptomyces sp. NBC_00687]MCX4916680.1 peptide-methionine (S)-S-oxide reductase MsrA [Streptomyces sp. NBC_00687]
MFLNSISDSHSPRLPTAEQALRGRPEPLFTLPERHTLFGTPLRGPYPEGLEIADFGMGCFWGAERRFWQLPAGVHTTLVGYQGGYTENPVYEEVCSGLTGHAEVVRVVHDPRVLPYDRLLQVFWESHNPTQGFRQRNDVGTQYRSTLHTHIRAQEVSAKASREAYQKVLTAAGHGTITTEILPATTRPFYPAEAHHQQYLASNPAGYCGLEGTGVPLSTSFATDFGTSCPAGISPAPESADQ